MKKVYLAGPDVFRQSAKNFGEYLRAKCMDYSFKGLYPFDNEVDPTLKGSLAAAEIFIANKKMIEKCDFVLANLTPFRGPSADVGTVWEMGYALALGKKVFAYSKRAPTDYKDRVGEDGYSVENFGLTDNLMVSLSATGGIFSTLEEALEEAYKYENGNSL